MAMGSSSSPTRYGKARCDSPLSGVPSRSTVAPAPSEVFAQGPERGCPARVRGLPVDGEPREPRGARPRCRPAPLGRHRGENPRGPPQPGAQVHVRVAHADVIVQKNEHADQLFQVVVRAREVEDRSPDSGAERLQLSRLRVALNADEGPRESGERLTQHLGFDPLEQDTEEVGALRGLGETGAPGHAEIRWRPELLEASARRCSAFGQRADRKRRRESGGEWVTEHKRQVTGETFEVGRVVGLVGPLATDVRALEQDAQTRVAAIAHATGDARERREEAHEEELVAETLLAVYRHRDALERRTRALLAGSPVPSEGFCLSVRTSAIVQPAFLVAPEREARPSEVIARLRVLGLGGGRLAEQADRLGERASVEISETERRR